MSHVSPTLPPHWWNDSTHCSRRPAFCASCASCTYGSKWYCRSSRSTMPHHTSTITPVTPAARSFVSSSCRRCGSAIVRVLASTVFSGSIADTSTARAAVAAGTRKHATVLVHGYCAEHNPFAPHKAQFANSLVFMANSTNMLNDEFAARIDAFLRAHDVRAAVAVAHSQGGKASLHLKAMYWSALDAAPDAVRVVQSVGTPWLGNSAMASFGSIGKVFGVTCGKNRDLTTAGAKRWLATIPLTERAGAYYYTTTYRLGKALGDYCSLGVNALLKWPNDGAAELKLAQLAGGNNMGNTERECHTRNMAYMAQCDDEKRNAIMNEHAQP
mmetsp:Transcript_12859/g.31793  ORF Transcript_12859/g.31793 Transcript_12859/m.31793 type:complete len:328 (-) Transcript_12859:32-1015(-)